MIKFDKKITTLKKRKNNMKLDKINHIIKPLVIILVLLFLLVNVNSVYAAKSPGDCETGLIKCLGGASIAGLTGGAQAALITASFCATGYAWCKTFYK
ncbi:MAG: hypothetical protein R6V04_03250 [bacterium]